MVTSQSLGSAMCAEKLACYVELMEELMPGMKRYSRHTGAHCLLGHGKLLLDMLHA